MSKMNLKQVTQLVILLGLLVLCLSACQCKHEWQGATCTTPKMCWKCGETEGEPLEHEWQEATCTAPKTCSRCGQQEGKANGHSEVIDVGIKATLSMAGKTQGSHCSVCGEVIIPQEEIPTKLDALIEEIKADNTLSDGVYSKYYHMSDFASQSDVIITQVITQQAKIDELYIAINYTPSTNNLSFSLSRIAEYSYTFLLSIDGGQSANQYSYGYKSELGESYIFGEINASTISKTQSLDYTYYDTSQQNMFYFYEPAYQKEAAQYAKQLIIFLDQLFVYKGLSIRASDFNLK